MDMLANSFSLLDLDQEDAKEQVQNATNAADSRKRRDNGEGLDKGSEDGKFLEKENSDQQTPEATLGDYRMPLVWIDLEMTELGGLKNLGLPSSIILVEKILVKLVESRLLSVDEQKLLKLDIRLPFIFPGLNIEVDRILEIACVITNGTLTKSIEGPDLVINQPKECLDKMGEWCQEHHAESGLTEKVLQSTITEQEAEKQVIEFVKRYIDTSSYTLMIAGNSVYMDLIFIRKYMPDLAALFSHVIVDVSSVKALCLRWHPKERKKAPQKENKHRAMDDIKESIAELKFYKEHIFKPRSRK